ncbi:hypothetical protein BD289DRAFT_10452 [Coniella lustricola]|uniref:Uncharacterized protein n=1 Tax=Coniella lustricola TaxID=2025994 RepID=A0A2T3A4L6_9PEZI|nr:hypothetical protein BD289DRAFT_10452 [Coniella lustricola]
MMASHDPAQVRCLYMPHVKSSASSFLPEYAQSIHSTHSLTHAPIQQYFRLLIEKSHGRISDMLHIPISENQSPKAFAVVLRAIYRKQVGIHERFERFSDRFQEVVVSIVTLEEPTNPPSAGVKMKNHLPISSSVQDDQLTDALQRPSLLKSVETRNFLDQYAPVLSASINSELPCTALMIHVVDHDRTRGDVANSVAFYTWHIVKIVIALVALV